MTKINLRLTSLVVLGIAFSFISMIGEDSVSAARAVTDRGTGCFVRVNPEGDDYVLDPACSAHDVLKLDDDGELDFYVYQDHGQLPEGSWRPSEAFRDSFEMCLNFPFGPVCGVVKESITPSGEYKSSFKSH